MTLNEVLLGVAIALVGAGLYMLWPEGQKTWGAILTAIGGILLVYLFVQVLFPPTFSIDIADLHLWKKSNPVDSSSNTEAYAIIRVENRGPTNSLVDWQLTATANDGQQYRAIIVETHGVDQFYTLDAKHPSPDDYSLDSSQQIVIETETPMTNGQWVMGFIFFRFKNVPIELLRQAGTLFTFECTDVLNQKHIKTEFEWRGRNDPPMKYPGLKYFTSQSLNENSN